MIYLEFKKSSLHWDFCIKISSKTDFILTIILLLLPFF